MNNLDYIFNPRSIAVIGASRRAESVGHGIMKSLTEGGVFKNRYSLPFEGNIYPVNDHAEIILGRKAYRSILHVPGRVDIAIIAVPALSVTGVMRE